MIRIHHLDVGNGARAGITEVDTSILPWPGATFSRSSSADDDQVRTSYALLAQTLETSVDRICSVHQVHGVRCVVIDDRVVDQSVPGREWGSPLPEADALITEVPGVIIGVKVADCCGVLIHDPFRGVVAAVHSGWRGSAQRITTRVVQQLVTDHACVPIDLFVALSPCASGERYEVGEDVHSALTEFCRPHPVKDGKWFFDNHAAIVSELEGVGVPSERIIVDPACTMTDRRFHSHRRDKDRAGRSFAFIGLNG